MKPSQDAIKQWLIEYLAKTLGIPGAEIDPDRKLAEYGLDSGASIGLVVDFETWLGVELPIDMLFEHVNIEKLSVFVVANWGSFPKL